MPADRSIGCSFLTLDRFTVDVSTVDLSRWTSSERRTQSRHKSNYNNKASSVNNVEEKSQKDYPGVGPFLPLRDSVAG